MVLIKNLKFFHLFIFGKISQQKLFEHILESKKAFSKSSTCSDHQEQQAIPSFNGIHRVEFLSMLLIVQFHGYW